MSFRGSPHARAHALERKLSFWEPFLVGGIRGEISFPPFSVKFHRVKKTFLALKRDAF